MTVKEFLSLETGTRIQWLPVGVNQKCQGVLFCQEERICVVWDDNTVAIYLYKPENVCNKEPYPASERISWVYLVGHGNPKHPSYLRITEDWFEDYTVVPV